MYFSIWEYFNTVTIQTENKGDL